MVRYYLWLLQLLGIANPKCHQLIQQYGSVRDVYRAVKENKDLRFLTAAEKKRLENATLENSDLILRNCEKNKIKTLTIDDKDYPYRLKNIFNPPVLLFYKGNIGGLDNEICVAGVGARSATEYTAKITRRICTDLSKTGVVLISGMAVGVDNLVHQSSVEAGGRTVGVLACGMNVDYPKGSIPYRERIYESGGACITELFPDERASKAYFQARNRIISGLAAGVMVFQADMISGSLITANYAIQQGRDLFCVPPNDVFKKEYAGVISYLRDGAIPLFNYLDVVNAYYSAFSDKSRLIDSGKYEVKPENHFIFTRKATETEKKKSSDEKTESASVTKKELDLSVFSESAVKIIECLKTGAVTLEKMTRELEISPSDISEILFDLELEGVISALPGAKYKLAE